jgi:ABC-type dipeptide/oligopeptide/nickel transport system permease subunit
VKRPIVVGAGGALVLLALCAVFAPLLSARPYSEQDLANSFAGPGDGFGWLGTDALGRDIWARLLIGLRISLAVAVFSQIVVVVVGVPVGLVAGYLGGRADRVLMRIVDSVMSFPVLLLAMVISANVRGTSANGTGIWSDVVRSVDDRTNGLTPALVVIAVLFWAPTARLVRSSVLRLRERDFVRASKSSGATHLHVMRRHVLPHIWGPVIVSAAIIVPFAVLTEAALSFLKLGVEPPTPSLGLMIAEGATSINSFPLQVLIPSAVLIAVTLLAQQLGNGLQQAFDEGQPR